MMEVERFRFFRIIYIVFGNWVIGKALRGYLVDCMRKFVDLYELLYNYFFKFIVKFVYLILEKIGGVK